MSAAQRTCLPLIAVHSVGSIGSIDEKPRYRLIRATFANWHENNGMEVHLQKLSTFTLWEPMYTRFQSTGWKCFPILKPQARELDRCCVCKVASNLWKNVWERFFCCVGASINKIRWCARKSGISIHSHLRATVYKSFMYNRAFKKRAPSTYCDFGLNRRAFNRKLL